MMADPAEEPLEFTRKSRFKRERFHDITPSNKPWRIKNAWPMRGVVFVVGASGARKTFFLIDGVLKVAAGAAKVWGRKARQCGVILVAAEDPEGCRARVRAWRLDKNRTSPLPFEMIGKAPNLLDGEEVDEIKAELRIAADEMAADGSPLGIIAFDTLSCCIAGADENSGMDMSKVLRTLAALAEEFDCLVVVAAHFGKGGSDRGIRGWSGLTANADGVAELVVDSEDPAVSRVKFQKVKNGPSGGELAFSLREVDLQMQDDDGEALTTCVVEFTAAKPTSARKRKKPLSPPEQIVLQAIRHVTDHGVTHPLPAGVEGAKPWFKAVTREDVHARAIVGGLAEETDKPATRRQRFKRALEGVCAKEHARMEGDFIWTV